MDWDIVQKIAVAFIPVITAYFAYVTKNKNRDLARIDVIIGEHQELIDRYKKEYNDLYDRFHKEVKDVNDYNKKLEERIKELEQSALEKQREIDKRGFDLTLYEGSAHYVPIPYFSKNDDGKMIFVNKAFENLFLIPQGLTKADYEGFEDAKIFGKERAKIFQDWDNIVKQTKKEVKFTTKANIKDKIYFLEIVKSPRFFQNKVIGIIGVVTRISTEPLIIDNTNLINL